MTRRSIVKSQEKCGIIVTVGFLDGLRDGDRGQAHPSQDFAIVDCSYASECLPNPQESNIDQLVFNTVQDRPPSAATWPRA